MSPRPQSGGPLFGEEDASSIPVDWWVAGAVLQHCHEKPGFIRKQMTKLKPTSPCGLPRHPPCRNPHCTNTIHRHQMWGGHGRSRCISLQQGTQPQEEVSSPFFSGSSSIALIQKHFLSGQGCPKAVNECHTSQKLLISHSGVARRRNCMVIKQNCLVPVN